MKRTIQMTVLVLCIILGSSWRNDLSAQSYPQDNAQYNDDEISYQRFYDELSPYGEWIDHPDYGYVWMPDAGPDFKPYATAGHWVWTDDYEWMWVSDYDWGWAPFHYGRWFEDAYYGWVWVPGYEWSPAWVAWRDGGDYYGWAPLRPGVNISVNFSIGSYDPPYNYWCFAPRRYITSPRIYDYCYDRGLNITIINQTTIINNYNYRRNVFCTGPRRADVEIYAGRILPFRFRESSRPGRCYFRGNEINVYRPLVRRDDDRRFAPRQFERYDRRNDGGRFRGDDNRFYRGNNGRQGRGDNGFGRNNGFGNRDNGNNSPRPDRNNNPGFDRRNNDMRPPQRDNNGNGWRRQQGGDNRVIRNDMPQPGNERVFRPSDRGTANPNGNNGYGQMETGGNGRRNDIPVRPPSQPGFGNGGNNDRRPDIQQQPNRSFEPRVNERRRDAQTPQPRIDNLGRSFEPRQMERRQDNPQPQQGRQFERRDNGGNDNGGRNNSGGNGNGRRRF